MRRGVINTLKVSFDGHAPSAGPHRGMTEVKFLRHVLEIVGRCDTGVPEANWTKGCVNDAGSNKSK